jgi:hypothetical protein
MAIIDVKTPCTEALAGRDAFDFEVIVPIDSAYGPKAKFWNDEGIKGCRQSMKEIQQYIADGASLFIFLLLAGIVGTVFSLGFGLVAGSFKFLRVYVFTFYAALIADLYIYCVKPMIMPSAHTIGDFLRTLLGGKFELTHKIYGAATVGEVFPSDSGYKAIGNGNSAAAVGVV